MHVIWPNLIIIRLNLYPPSLLDHHEDNHGPHDHDDHDSHQHPTLLPSRPGPPPPHLQQMPVSNSLRYWNSIYRWRSWWGFTFTIMLLRRLSTWSILYHRPDENQANGENPSKYHVPRQHWLSGAAWLLSFNTAALLVAIIIFEMMRCFCWKLYLWWSSLSTRTTEMFTSFSSPHQFDV